MKKFMSVFILFAVIFTGFIAPATYETTPEKTVKVLSANSVDDDLPWWKEGLKKDNIICNEKIVHTPSSHIFLYDNVNKITVYRDYINDRNRGSEDSYEYKDFEKLVNTATETEDLGERVFTNYYLDLVTLDDTKYSFYFYENGVWLIQSLPEKDADKNVKLKFDPTYYQNLLQKI